MNLAKSPVNKGLQGTPNTPHRLTRMNPKMMYLG